MDYSVNSHEKSGVPPYIQLVLKWSQNGPNIVPKYFQNDPEIVPYWSQNGPKMVLKWSKIDPHDIPKVVLNNSDKDSQ